MKRLSRHQKNMRTKKKYEREYKKVNKRGKKTRNSSIGNCANTDYRLSGLKKVEWNYTRNGNELYYLFAFFAPTTP